MLIYAVEISINKAVAADWLKWMEEIHVPEVMKTGCFITHLLEEVGSSGNNGSERVTYTIKYGCRSMEDYKRYVATYADELQAKHIERFNGDFSASRILMESKEISNSKDSLVLQVTA